MKQMNTIVYDETTAECQKEHCLTMKDLTYAVKEIGGIEKVPRLCAPTPRIIKGSNDDNNRWWSPMVDVVYKEQEFRYELAIERFGEAAVKDHKGGCLPIENIVEDVAKAEKAEAEAAM